MQPSLDLPEKDGQGWVYASITVRDGRRRLKPAQVAYDRLIFSTPPRLISERVEIILVNGDAEQRHTARVLPHDADATRVPIRLLSMQ
jgi:hypothetical protein